MLLQLTDWKTSDYNRDEDKAKAKANPYDKGKPVIVNSDFIVRIESDIGHSPPACRITFARGEALSHLDVLDTADEIMGQLATMHGIKF